ncbi:MAG: L,D-transpeptidase/peptidoglycan binding protein [Clostridium sp.]|uniref:L,D-transpeptidase family protein n=1 Tax=Clostridium sp. TaxID=1506 RepID=UPI0025BCB08F|nr:L,D-transpeptidase family protein [Clostridium sp.]MBS5925547.1 L,D-transpeptidase/peptidoglycan binding protein [Clostridium sp.]
MEGHGKKNRKNKSKLVVFTIIGVAVIVYLAFAIYFKDRFYFGASINSISISGKTVNEVKGELSLDGENYLLTIKERGGIEETISGKDIGLYFDINEEKIEDIKGKQNPLGWIRSLFSKEEYKVEKLLKYDEELLEKKINELKCLNEENMIKPKNPNLVYSNYKYDIIPEDNGKYINKEVLLKSISDTINNNKKEIDLEKAGCYTNPNYNSKSKEVTNAKNTMDKYVSSKITLKILDKSKYIDGEIISQWITLDENYNVGLDKTKIASYINNLTSSYNTVGKTRSFKASSGNIVNVSGGDYGRKINNTRYVDEVVTAIKNGQTVTKEYNIAQSTINGTSSDIGNTYVEINLTKQHIWCYNEGVLVTEGDIVTGNVSKGWATPQGVYKLKSKERDRVLRGPGYASPVTYWMPFNGGIGLHDATWRNSFGGSIYKNNGSHGCINLPYNVASEIYNSIKVGDPIVCYFE